MPFQRYFHSVFAAETKWHKKYLAFLLCFALIFILIAIRIIREPVKPKHANLGTLIGLYLFVATGIFLLLQALDAFKKTASVLWRAALALVAGSAFVVWLFVLLLWVLNVFGF
jgi:CDP-diglyceride synthetase